MDFTLRFTMLSDWHVGAGFGRPGSVDRLLVRGPDDLPFLPAKTIRGMWRDAAERLARALDGGEPAGPWQQLVDDVFGTQPQLARDKRDPSGYHNDPTQAPRETALWVSPARLSDALRLRLKRRPAPKNVPEAARQQFESEERGRAALRAAVSFVKPGVAIDELSGRAKDDFLRFEEMGRAGTVLVANVRFDPARLGGEGHARFRAARALALAATRLITRIGGKRRRGAGRCEVAVAGAGADVARAIADLKQITSVPAPPDPRTVQAADLPAPTASTGEWLAVPLTITLNGPVAVPARTVGNVVETLDFVPGTFLLPHVTRVLREQKIDARAAIARGDIRVLNATIDVNGSPGRPVPFCLSSEKGAKTAPETIFNGLIQAEQAGKQYKQMRAVYVGPPDPKDWPKVPKTVGTHNVVEDQRQRPTEDVGGVYSFEAIAPTDSKRDNAPVVLRAELRVRRTLLPANIDWTKFGGAVRLGISKKDDYGEVSVACAGAAGEPPPAIKSPLAANPALKDRDLFVWLISDVLLRGPGGQPEPTVEALRAALQDRLRLPLTVAKTEAGLPLQFARARRTESWQTGWGLPRPSLVGLQAGTCIRFEAKFVPDPALMNEVEWSGLGERTAEGFGQIRFNDPLVTREPKMWIAADLGPVVPDRSPNSEPAKSLGADDTTAVHVVRAAWRESVRAAVLAATATPEYRTDLFFWVAGRPNMSQLGGLRSVVQSLKADADAGRVRGWLDAVAANRRRADRWPPGALDRIRALLDQPTRVWEILRDERACPGLQYIAWPTLGGAAANLESELRWFAVRALLDAAIRAHKRAGENEGRN